jgi:hypothetical protein
MVSFQNINAQNIEINGFTGWQLGGKAKLYDGEFRIQDAMNYGGRISVGMSTTTYAEITYMRSDTEGRFYPYGIGGPSDIVPLSSNYIQVGGLQEVHFGPVAPYLTIALGLTIWDPKTSAVNGKTQFSFSGGGGLKIWLTDFLGIRLQGTALMPLVYNGFGIGCGIGTGGSGCSSNLYTRVTPFQGEFSGGIIIKLSPN